MIMENPSITRGVLAREAGVHAETVRFYEKRGLLEKPKRSLSNYREYPSETVIRIRFIKRAQELGFTLNEIGELLALRTNPERTNSDVKSLACEKLKVIEQKIRDLQMMRKILADLTAACDGRGSVANCPIIAAMEGHL
jgi:MerR family transcriptional regulator, copper efflux regulator